MSSLMVPPASVRGMTRLDRDSFTKTILVPCFKLGPTKLSEVTPTLKKYILKLKNLKPIQTKENQTIVYLDPKKIVSMDDIDPADVEILRKYVKDIEQLELTLKYENWQSDDIFRAVLPENIEIPTSFSKIGHIVHLNLRDSQLPYKNLIGEVLLDNVPQARSVVNKLNVIDTTYRHFSMEILAGENDTVATVKENGFTYKFDFAKVYWNPRLSTEHAKLLTLMKKGDVLYDVFAGVGPFAVPAARKGIKVLANDLNPESYKWLKHNAGSNKVQNFQAYNKDGRDFLLEEVKTDILERINEKLCGMQHIAMNLPALAVEFLDILRGWFNDDDTKKVCENPPIVHLYCFVKTDKGDDPSSLAKLLVEEKIGCSLSNEALKVIHHVRNVSPNKEMMRVSFAVMENMIREEEPSRKRPKIDTSEKFIDNNIAGCNGKEQEKCKDEKCI
ncbi:tRNA (guanine(37)-N1)-methyltransferase [Venturia canescens]|uniref:tRNA (guanine(37)-N1)-methyltransferase n=1 Tax=Venturia canescens TaxID=32260 RepID=UPI001C9CAF9A|nr:tRNA (guanine(37)-N1)-methyltransferase [Venturia canescens]